MIFHGQIIGGTPEWKSLRVGKVTASNIDRIITPKTGKLSSQAEMYANQVAAERHLGREIVHFKGNYYTERGKELEPDAIRLYEMQSGYDCEHIGFISNDALTHGCSPDAVIGRARGLELKCPEADTHVSYLCSGTLPDEYKCQVQGSLFITGFSEWDFMSYYPEIRPLIITVKPDLEFHEKLAKGLEEFEALVKCKLDIIRGN